MDFNQNIKLSRIAITGDIRETDSPYQYGDELNELLHQTHTKVMSRKMKNPQPLLKLISKHSNVPAFRNYLFNLYNLAGKKEKAQEVNQRLMEKFPDYIFAKINHAAHYLSRQEYEKIPEVIGEALTLDGLCPERKVFHLSEFKSFESLVVHYLLRTQRLEAANSHINICEEVLGFQDPVVRNLRKQYKELMAFQHLLPYQTALEKRAREGDYFRERPLPEQVTAAPQLTHEELWVLYQKDISIEPEILKQTLKLPRESLIADLETIIIDAAQRKQAIEKEREGKNWEEAPLDFLLHAIALLTELGAKTQMPLVLKTLSYSDDLGDYYLDMHLTETLWQFFYRLYQDDLAGLYTFMASPAYSYDAKGIVMQAMTQIAVRHPEQRQAVIDYYDQLFDLFIDQLDNPDISDVEVMSTMVSEALTLRAVDLLPKIKILMELGLIDEMFCGDFEAVSSQMAEAGGDRQYDYSPNVFELYQHINETWHAEGGAEEREVLDLLLKGLEEEKKELEAEQNRLYREEPVERKPLFSEKKIGRNEPCPCGSGKKYKRCCL